MNPFYSWRWEKVVRIRATDEELGKGCLLVALGDTRATHLSCLTFSCPQTLISSSAEFRHAAAAPPAAAGGGLCVTGI